MDIRSLKGKSPIVEVIRESGYQLMEGAGGEFVNSDNPGLRVDAERGRYKWQEKNESGDVIAWLENRYGWNFGQVVRFLENRLKIAPDDRMVKINDTMGGAPEELYELDSWPVAGGGESLPDTWWVREARKLTYDLPISFDELSSIGVVGLLDRFGGIPRLFVPVMGDMEELEFCSGCLRDFEPGWKEGAAFLAFGVGANYEMLSGSSMDRNSGVYCRACVDRYGRWIRAVDLFVAHAPLTCEKVGDFAGQA